jgi:hypothetical protein
MPKIFKDGISHYLNTTADLARLDPALRDWAVQHGPTFTGALDLLIGNAKKAAN